ncbi:MAG: thioredoxin family protein [Nigerium sp.]|nr:thioredoxin family protein [Nigerium sp.]
MDIKVLSTGCCATLHERTREAVAQLGWDTPVESVTDFAAIASFGVLKVPALVIDGEVVLAGRTPTATEIAHLLTSRR